MRAMLKLSLAYAELERVSGVLMKGKMVNIDYVVEENQDFVE